jgi:hypothetical protein
MTPNENRADRARNLEIAVFRHCTDHPGSTVLRHTEFYAEVVSPTFTPKGKKIIAVIAIGTFGLALPFIFAMWFAAKPVLYTFKSLPNGDVFTTFSGYDPSRIDWSTFPDISE